MGIAMKGVVIPKGSGLKIGMALTITFSFNSVPTGATAVSLLDGFNGTFVWNSIDKTLTFTIGFGEPFDVNDGFIIQFVDETGTPVAEAQVLDITEATDISIESAVDEAVLEEIVTNAPLDPPVELTPEQVSPTGTGDPLTSSPVYSVESTSVSTAGSGGGGFTANSGGSTSSSKQSPVTVSSTTTSRSTYGGTTTNGGSGATATTTALSSSNTAVAYSATAPGASTDSIAPPGGYSSAPDPSTAASDPAPSGPNVAPVVIPPEPPIPDPVLVDTDGDPGTPELLVYPPDWVSPPEVRLSWDNNGNQQYYVKPDETAEYIFEVNPTWTGDVSAGAGLTTNVITDISLTEGALPPGFVLEYPYLGDPNKARVHGTMPVISYPREYYFIITATNEHGVFHDKIFSIFAEPDRGFFVFNGTLDLGAGLTNSIEVGVGTNITKMYVKMWGAGGGGNGAGFMGGGGSFARCLIDVTEGDGIGMVLGYGGAFAGSAIPSSGAGENTYIAYVDYDNDPQSGTFGQVLSTTLTCRAQGGAGATNTADGGNPNTQSIGDEIIVGNGVYPGSHLNKHAGTSGNGYGGAGAQDGYLGRIYFEYGPHINAANSINDLD